MIRFIDLGKQVGGDNSDEDYPREFAFFNTVSDLFIVVQGQQVFSSLFHFENLCKQIVYGQRALDEATTARCVALCPEWTNERLTSRRS